MTKVLAYFPRLRHDSYPDVKFLVDILPDLIVDFLPVVEALQTVVTAFVSPHQTRPELAASVLNKVCCVSESRSHYKEWSVM